MSLYPLKFEPRLVEKIWGGRKLETVLGKHLPPEKLIGESWEIYDFPPGVVENSTDWVSSRIINGEHSGRTLHWAVGELSNDLLGNAKAVGPSGQFPLLIKFLDAREDLSVQVHPDAKYAQAHAGAHLKTEAWFVIQNEPDARLLLGVQPGTSREQFRRATATGEVERHLASVPARVGDCHYLPSGTVHALGAGTLVAEVQTPSDTTFRVYDFGRVDPSTGKPRTLHVEQAMECIDFNSPAPAAKAPNDSTLAQSPFFEIRRGSMPEHSMHELPSGQMRILMMIEGQAHIRSSASSDETSIIIGETVLVPAALKNPVLKSTSACSWLEITVPQ